RRQPVASTGFTMSAGIAARRRGTCPCFQIGGTFRSEGWCMGAVRFAGGGDSPAPAGGARGQDLLERRRQAVPRGVWNSTPLFIDRAEGALVWDVDGNRYIDFAGGIGVLNVGHGRSEVTGAVRAQAERFTHTCFHVAMYEGYVAVAEWLNRRTPGTHARKTLLVNSGAEAVENAVK